MYLLPSYDHVHMFRCCRAYHMACLSPAVTRADIIANQIAKKKQLRLASSSGSVSSDGEDEEEDEEDNDVDEDWFCPQCDCLQVCFQSTKLPVVMALPLQRF